MRQVLLTRRAALAGLGSAAGALALLSCGDSSSTGTAVSANSAASAASACVTSPEGEIGPYFVDDSAAGFNRSDIRSNLDGTNTQNGIPFTLNIVVGDSENSCAGMQGVQVDIWHCNAEGVYSDEGVESTTGETWLRGYQLTDTAGYVTFTTIFPGWYQGRTTHIHLRLRSKYSSASSTSDGTNTTQVFFAQALIDTINTTVAPYSSHGSNPTSNESDRVYSEQTEGKMELVLTGDSTAGYSATAIIDLPITAAG